jgi:hypothetical protein
VFNVPPNIANYLNRGYVVAAELEATPPTRCFVRIRPIAKPGTRREEPHRFLNSPIDLFEYWEFSFRRMVLRAGWEADEWNYDRYLLEDEQCHTITEAEFHCAIQRWIPDTKLLRHSSESPCPE